MKTASVYIHFPHCDIKCAYCDFYSIAQRTIEPSFYEKYLFHLEQDLLQKKNYISENTLIKTIFLGGGTPSKVPPEYLARLFILLKSHLNISPAAEISLEANPESLSEEILQNYLKIGINRLNIGLQTTKPNLLRYLGRVYRSSSYLNVLTHIRKAGFTNYGADLIYGIPSQRIEDLCSDIDWLISEGVSHISAYCLTLEKDTLLESQISKGIKKAPSVRRQDYHYRFVVEYLEEKGFDRYEISNFARKGFHSRHNLLGWKYFPYIGLGVSSHSFLPPFRLISPRNISHYLNGEYFRFEPEKILPDILIGICRLTKFQNFLQVQRKLTQGYFPGFFLSLKVFSDRGWVKLYPTGFSITKRGSRFSDTMLSELNETLGSV